MNHRVLPVLAFLLPLCVLAQHPSLRPGIRTAAYRSEQKAVVPLKQSEAVVSSHPASQQTGLVNVIDLGTSADALSYGYSGGQRTLVWADDSLKTIINIHTMGPGTTPPGLSGYLAVDRGVNMGTTPADWTTNLQVYAATLNTGGTFLPDEARYPQAGLFDPLRSGNPDSTRIVYFAPNLSNTITTWGGYSYGTAKLYTPADSSKYLYWYDPPPYTYIPDGFTITNNGYVLVTDIDQDWEGGSGVYQGAVLLHIGVWDTVLHDFVYAINNSLPLATIGNRIPTSARVAANRYGDMFWISVIGDDGSSGGVGGMSSLYPIFWRCWTDGGVWSDPHGIQLDGPNGLPGIVDGMLSDYRITQTFMPPYPSRDEISYTTAFDCDMVVDLCGTVHIGAIIGLTGPDPYSIVIGEPGDSLLAAYDIYSSDGGITWTAVKMGTVQTFRGTFGNITEDNRINLSVSEYGDKVFCSWLDTQIPGVSDNSSPDVFARGLWVEMNYLSSKNGSSADNLTGSTDIAHQAWFGTASHYMFTDGDDVILPICTEFLSDPNDETKPVSFRYLSGIRYSPSDFQWQNNQEPPCWLGLEDKQQKPLFVQVSPNPSHGNAHIQLTMQESGVVNLCLSDLTGKTVVNRSKGWLTSGNHEFDLDLSGVSPGCYFCTLTAGHHSSTVRVIVY